MKHYFLEHPLYEITEKMITSRKSIELVRSIVLCIKANAIKMLLQINAENII